jgi:hypothetical protein
MQKIIFIHSFQKIFERGRFGVESVSKTLKGLFEFFFQQKQIFRWSITCANDAGTNDTYTNKTEYNLQEYHLYEWYLYKWHSYEWILHK